MINICPLRLLPQLWRLQPSSLVGAAVGEMTAAAETLSRTVRAAVAVAAATGVDATLGASSVFFLSLSPTTLSQALATFNVDWKAWGEFPANATSTAAVPSSSSSSHMYPLFDEFVPQLYRASFADFSDLLSDTLTALGPSWGLPPPPVIDVATAPSSGLQGSPSASATKSNSSNGDSRSPGNSDDEGGGGGGVVLGVGLRIDGSGSATPWDDLEAMLNDLNASAAQVKNSGDSRGVVWMVWMEWVVKWVDLWWLAGLVRVGGLESVAALGSRDRSPPPISPPMLLLSLFYSVSFFF